MAIKRLTALADIFSDNNLCNSIFGLGGNDTINGLGGNDIIDGGTGADTMRGGLGNDTYIVDNALDKTIELSGQGIDLVKTGLSWTLAANVDNLTITGLIARNGTGNTLHNVITGNGAANILNGGAGADALIGGGGNDTYIVDNSGDTVSDTSGIDTVKSSISYTLGSTIEKLTLLGATNINGTGNGLANTITGNAGNNVLDGKAGADLMIGGGGNDKYYVDDVGDVINDTSGVDTVVANIQGYVLGSGMENLVCQSFGGTGNELDNYIIGSAFDHEDIRGEGGNDRLYSGGGPGDRLWGGDGADRFGFDFNNVGYTATGAIFLQDYTPGTDFLELQASLFGRNPGDTILELSDAGLNYDISLNALVSSQGVLFVFQNLTPNVNNVIGSDIIFV